MSDFVLFTHTLWSEAPRIRHQVARLLASAGHRVLFVERAHHALTFVGLDHRTAEPGITLLRGRRLVHHQLRPAQPLDWLNDRIAAASLRKLLREARVTPKFNIINFAHDGAFLKREFPDQTMVTIIHDNFEAQARLRPFGHVTRNLRATCLASDRVLAVSTPLLKRLSEWCTPELFLPWSQKPYAAPSSGTEGRDTLLFWGHVDIGLDTERIRSMSNFLTKVHPGIRMLFVGPTQVPSRRARTVDRLAGLPNVEVHGAHELDELPLRRTLAALIPYRRKGDVDATELPNKALPLLSRGLPIMKSGLPHMVRAPFILPVDDDAALDDAIGQCRQSFDAWQPLIRAMVDSNGPEARLRTLGVDRAP
jgi:hypothetical protein